MTTTPKSQGAAIDQAGAPAGIIYQVRNGRGVWSDVDKEIYEQYTGRSYERRIVTLFIPTGDTQQASGDGLVSVKDRLPNTEHECTSRDMMVSNSFYVRGVAMDGGEGFGMADYQEDGKWHCYGGDYDFMHIAEVTHYLPIMSSAPAQQASEDARDAALVQARDALNSMLWQFTGTPSTFKDSNARAQGHAAVAAIDAAMSASRANKAGLDGAA